MEYLVGAACESMWGFKYFFKTFISVDINLNADITKK